MNVVLIADRFKGKPTKVIKKIIPFDKLKENIVYVNVCPVVEQFIIRLCFSRFGNNKHIKKHQQFKKRRTSLTHGDLNKLKGKIKKNTTYIIGIKTVDFCNFKIDDAYFFKSKNMERVLFKPPILAYAIKKAVVGKSSAHHNSYIRNSIL